jgi:predicted nucleic acid-binding protein
MSKFVIVDTCFWFGFYNTNDQHHQDSLLYYDFLDFHNLILPWPSLYETLNTKFVERRDWLSQFQAYAQRPNITRFDDTPYRDAAYENLFRENIRDRKLSFVDCIIREIMKDSSVCIDSILTFNKKDFIDICSKRNVAFFDG